MLYRQATYREHQHPPRGFTLVELVSTIVILATVSVLASGIIMQATNGYVSAKTTSQLHTEMSIALDRALREIRHIRKDPDVDGLAPDIDSKTKTSIIWDDNSSLTLSGSNLVLTINNDGGHVLLKDVTDLTIRAYNDSNTQLAAGLAGAACDPIRRIEVNITAQRHGVTHSLRGKVFLRCASQPNAE